jgi:hypothetical protein
MMAARSLERGQSLVFFALVFIFLIVPFTALAIDLPSLWTSRRDRQKLADEACLAGSIAAQNGDDVYSAIIQSLDDNGVDASLYTPNEGSGTDLGKGIETGSSLRVALWGPTLSWWSQLIPDVDGWEIGARAHCQEGLGGVLPLALKEWEGPGSKILETSDPNDEWSQPCPDQSIDPESDVATRNPPYCWVWGDLQVLAGDGHRVNEGDTSMNGLIGPDVRCQDFTAPDHWDELCVNKVYIPPAVGGAINPLKNLTMGYIAAGGYNGPLPYPGTYTGEHSALIAQQEGVSNNFLAQEVGQRYDVGDNLLVFVYRDGELFDGNKNFDYVEVIGYAVVRLDYIDANTVAVRPVYPAHNLGDISIADDLPKSFEEVGEAGFDIYPVLLPWD